MPFRQHLHNREAQPGASDSGKVRFVQPYKWIEDICQAAAWNADPLIGHFDFGLPRRRKCTCLNFYFAATGRVFDRI